MLDYHDHHLQLNVVTHIYTGCWLIRHLFELKFDCNPWEIENRMRLCSYIKYIFGYNISKCTIQLSMCNGSTLTILFYVYLQEKHLSFHSITDAFTLAIRNTNKKSICMYLKLICQWKRKQTRWSQTKGNDSEGCILRYEVLLNYSRQDIFWGFWCNTKCQHEKWPYLDVPYVVF